MLTKTNYIIWRDCKKNAWLKLHKPEVYFEHELSDFEKSIIETGNEVELEARKLFPTGELIDLKGTDAVEPTRILLEKKVPTIFQAAFEKDGYFAAVDVLKYDPKTDKYSIYEIKATNEVDKETHLNDLAFQYVLLKRAGLTIEKANLIHLNPEYVREGELDLTQLFAIEDMTEKMREMEAEVEGEMERAKLYIEKGEEPYGPCDCVYKGRSAHCTTFHYSNPHIPEYGIHDLVRIGLSKRKLLELVDGNKLRLEDIPPEYDLSDPQKNQVMTYINDRTIISHEGIAEEFDKLVFPLYFLDYETFPSALPRYDGFSPYQQIPFQYSLHVLDAPDAEPEHFEFLYRKEDDPSRAFADSLQTNLGNKGSIIVWHKSFECSRNKEVAERLPGFKAFFAEVEQRVFDLEDIFKKQYHVHKDFYGSTSIKYVLPVLVPELSYKNLVIREGGTASQKWNEMVTSGALSQEERDEIYNHLLVYCKLDTYAMYAIWRELWKLVN